VSFRSDNLLLETLLRLYFFFLWLKGFKAHNIGAYNDDRRRRQLCTIERLPIFSYRDFGIYHDQTCSCSGYCVGIILLLYTHGRKGRLLSSYIAVHRNRLRSPILLSIQTYIA